MNPVPSESNYYHIVILPLVVTVSGLIDEVTSWASGMDFEPYNELFSYQLLIQNSGPHVTQLNSLGQLSLQLSPTKKTAILKGLTFYARILAYSTKSNELSACIKTVHRGNKIFTKTFSRIAV